MFYERLCYNTGMDTQEQVIVRESNGRFAPGTRAGAPPITTENARDMLRARALKRARLSTEGALLATVRPDLIHKYGDDAPLVERAMTLQTIATTPEAGKAAVMSAQYLDKLQGYADDPADAGQVVDAVAGLVRELALFAAQMMPNAFDNSNYRKHEAVEAGQPSDTGNTGRVQADEESGGAVVGDG